MSDWLSVLCGLGDFSPVEGAISDNSAAGLLLKMDGASYAFAGEPGGSVELGDDRGVSVFSDFNGDGVIDSISTVLFDGDCFTVECEQRSDSAQRWGLTPAYILGGVDRGDSTWGLVEQITPEGVAEHWWGLDGKVQDM